jgi:nucleoside phosphorylase
MTTAGRGNDGDHEVDPAVVNHLPEPRPAWAVESADHPTIGLVTAIPEEFAAVRALLDVSFERNVFGDPATYVLGSIPSREAGRSHHTALTLLGETATDAAADGCTHLLRSFPSVVAVVMVGIAAGIPNRDRPERHVRLGDVVVATQGIIDYGHVRGVAGGDQPRRQFPRPSPRFVRCADMLKADEFGGLRPWEQWLGVDRPPNLAGYDRPAPQSDVLRDGVGNRLPHPRRNLSGHVKGMPKVHYGSIGSADISVRDAATRDELAAQHGFLAVEMEGAGIGRSSFLNGKEWFVIRGVSDYGDGHRDDAWRRHASLTAAAYLRSLLAKCLPLESQYGHGHASMTSFP